jgi:hypothetical protein
MVKLSDDLWRRVSKAVEHPFSDKLTDKSLLIALHGEVFSSDLCKTCENEQIRAYIELYRIINPKQGATMNPPSKKYRFNPLHEDKTLSLRGVRGPITAENLTDDVAKRLVKSGNYADLIVTVEEAESIREKMDSQPDSEEFKSGDLLAKEAIEHIENTPADELDGFLSDGEKRSTVLAAWSEKFPD